MVTQISPKELREKLENKSVYYTLKGISEKASTYGSGYRNHRVIAIGHLAGTYVRKVDGNELPGLDEKTTFKELEELDGKNYGLLMELLYPLLGIFFDS